MLLGVLALCGCGGKQKLKLYIPGEYMSETLIPNFEEQYNCEVIVELFDSNEIMYTKVCAGDTYDVLVPSDYMIERLIKEDMLQKIDRSKITNFDNLADAVKGLPFDSQNEYSIPYFWGTVGIVYNHNTVPKELVEQQGFEIFRNTDYKGRIYFYDSERDAFMVALKALGYSSNTDKEDELNAAYEWLVKMAQTMEPDIVGDEVIDGMMNGYNDLAIVYSGDAACILAENSDMSYSMPSSGSNLWTDACVIPKNAENPELANAFLNYVLDYNAAFDNSAAVGYASPNKDVLADMTAPGGDYEGNEAYLPRSYELDEVFNDNQIIRKKVSELWIKVKAAK